MSEVDIAFVDKGVVMRVIGLVAGCTAAGVVAHCVICRDRIVAEARPVKQVVTKVGGKAMLVVDSLDRGMILSGGVLAFGWMGTQRATMRAVLLAVSWIPWMVR